MTFVSTRGESPALSLLDAVAQGLAPDGGLYVPEALPDLTPHLESWRVLSYTDLAAAFLSQFAPDQSALLAGCVVRAYAAFPPEPAPLVRLAPGLQVLELFHGPTLAFKDFALQLLGQLYGALDRPVHILGATSGDTGSAAIQGMLGVRGAHSVILYPEGRIAPLQERQIACTGSERVHALAVQGTFDEAQAIVKTLLAEDALREQYHLSAVNSINIARILAQSVYYLWAALRTPGPLTFIVPTGNFGNVLAGWLLRRMGLPNLRFRVATNQNAVVARYFQTGVYAPETVLPSLAPSMDIQLASNFERFRWYAGDQPFDHQGITASIADDAIIRAQLAAVWERYGYVVDPHTACAFAQPLPTDGESVVVATAHPAKFPETVEAVLGQRITHPSLEALLGRPLHRTVLPATPDVIRAYITAHLPAH